MRRNERKRRPLIKEAGIAVIGEGPTEQYYLQSLQGILPVNVYPKVTKDGMDYLVQRVEQCIREGFDKVYCLIDMDNKRKGKEKTEYDQFLRKYSGKSFRNKNTGEETEVIVIENNPCLEIWFLYYFKYTTGLYSSYERINPLKPELKKYLPEYEKRIEFFKKCGGLHQYLTDKGGQLDLASKNSRKSIESVGSDKVSAFSGMAIFFDGFQD